MLDLIEDLRDAALDEVDVRVLVTDGDRPPWFGHSVPIRGVQWIEEDGTAVLVIETGER